MPASRVPTGLGTSLEGVDVPGAGPSALRTRRRGEFESREGRQHVDRWIHRDGWSAGSDRQKHAAPRIAPETPGAIRGIKCESSPVDPHVPASTGRISKTQARPALPPRRASFSDGSSRRMHVRAGVRPRAIASTLPGLCRKYGTEIPHPPNGSKSFLFRHPSAKVRLTWPENPRIDRPARRCVLPDAAAPCFKRHRHGNRP